MLVNSINVMNSVNSKYNSQSFKARIRIDKTTLGIIGTSVASGYMASIASGTNASDILAISDPKNPIFESMISDGDNSTMREISSVCSIPLALSGTVSAIIYDKQDPNSKKDQENNRINPS